LETESMVNLTYLSCNWQKTVSNV